MATGYASFSNRDKLATARLAAAKSYPYFISALMALVPKEAPGLGTIGVTEDYILLIDWDVVGQWSMEQLKGVLIHEINHVLREHHRRVKALGVLSKEELTCWRLGSDFEINDDLQQAHPELFAKTTPEDRRGVLPKDHELEDGLIAEEYFRQLRDKMQKQPQSGKGGKGQQQKQQQQSQGDGDNEQQGEQEPGHAAAGRCGSCCDGKEDAKEKQARQGEVGRTELEIERVRKQTAEAIKEAAQKSRGSVPDGMLRWAEGVLKPPKVRWQDKLRRLAKNAVAWKAGMVDLSHTKISRRQWGVGIGAGRPLIPAYRAPCPTIAIIADTSGSMGPTELTACLREAKGVLEQTGARVVFGACDAMCYGIKTVARWQEIPRLLKGGGGTDFRPAFEALEKGGKQKRPDIVIFMTDGYGPAPEVEPKWCTTIWMLIGENPNIPATWGHKVEVKD